MTRADDNELLRRYAGERAEAAFAELVRRHLNLVYAVALRRTDGDAALAKDVSQQVFVALARHAKALQDHPALAGWLHRTTRHLAANAVRSERARKLRERDHAMHDSLTAPDFHPTWAEIRPHLDELIDQLDARSRDVLVRRFFSGEKFADIGAALHLSEDAARMRVDRALERMRVLLARRGVSSTSAALGTLLAALPAGAAPAGLAAMVTSAAVSVAPLVTPLAVVSAATLMNTSKIAAAAWTAAAVLTLGGAYLSHEAGATRAQLQALTRDSAASRAVSATAVPGAMPNSAAGKSAGRALAPATVQPFVPVQLSQEEFAALLARQRALSPAAQRDRDLLANRIRVRLRFHALYAMLGLSREQIERFETEASVQNLTFSELVGTREQVAQHRRDETRRLDRVVTAALGTGLTAAFRDYLRTSDLRAVAGQLAADTYFTETPLSAAQAERLVRLCAEHRGGDEGYARIDVNAVDWSAVLARAGEILTPVQSHALRARLSKRLFDIEFERATRLPLRRPIRGL